MNDTLLLQPDVNGYVSEKFLRHVLINQIRNTSLPGFVPTNGAQFNVENGAAEEYADYFVLQIKKGSALQAFYYNREAVPSTGSLFEKERVGLFSIDPKQDSGIRREDLMDPLKNIIAGLRLYEKLILESGKLPPISGVISI